MTVARILPLALLSLLLVPAASAASGVVISEFRFRGPAGASDEFVELHNPGETPIDVSGWLLQACSGTGAGPAARATLPPGTVLGPRRHLLIGGPGYAGVVTPDATYALGVADGGGVRLVNPVGLAMDAVGAGTSNVSCREGSGLPALSTDGALASYHRLGGAVDTDANALDFEGPSPGAPQSLASAAKPGAPHGLVATPGEAPGSAQIAWQSPLDDGGAAVSYYRVHRGIAPGELAWVANVLGLAYEDEGLAPGATYGYVVTAVNAEGEGSRSAEAWAIAQVGEDANEPVPELGTLALLGAGVGLIVMARRRA